VNEARGNRVRFHGEGTHRPSTHGFMEYDAVIADRLEPTIAETCRAVGKRPDLSRVLPRPGPEFPDYRRVRMVGGRQGDPLGGGQGRHIAEFIPYCLIHLSLNSVFSRRTTF
jgi:hypothetical protein